MKSSIITAILFSFFAIAAKANSIPSKNNTALVDSAKQVELPQFLSIYYDLKNALASDNSATAATKAAALLNATQHTDTKSLTKAQKDAVIALNYKLEYDSRHISESKDIAHQREHFAALSLNMWKLAKTVKLSAQPVYELYCPMKKTYWLSSESVIKNPYYGKEMPTCGKVASTLK